MQPEVQRYLAERLETLRLLRQLGNDVAGTLAHVGGSLEAFRLLGAVTDEEWQDWGGRASEAAGLPSVSLRGRSELHTGGGISDAASSESKAPRHQPAPGFETAQFVRLVPGPNVEHEVSGARLRLMGLEIYDSRMALLWRLCSLKHGQSLELDPLRDTENDAEGLPERDRNRLRSRARGRIPFYLADWCECSDDVGTAYRVVAGGAGGSADEMTGRTVIVPAAPPGASTLKITTQGHDFEFALASGS